MAEAPVAAGRRAWIDVARGAAVSLVVLLHVSNFFNRRDVRVADSVLALNHLLDGVRMPTLVGLSGILAAAVVTWTWRDVWRRRVGPLLLLYYVWTVVAILVGMPLLHGRTVTEMWPRLLEAFTRPEPYVWYLLALACYIASARLLRKVPTWALLTAAIGAYLVYRTWTSRPPVDGFGGWLRLGYYWIFFVLGERGSRLWMRWGDTSEWKRALLAGATFVGVGGVIVFGLGWRLEPIPSLILCVLGFACAIAVAGATAHTKAMRWARAIGRRSLGVYAIHAWLAFGIWVRIEDYVPDFRGAGVILPIGYTIFVVASAYWITAALARWVPVPFVRPWWSMARRDAEPATRPAGAGAQ